MRITGAIIRRVALGAIVTLLPATMFDAEA
jgi:hypothetical protein